ncbi:MAG: DUF4153 domain-containing protein, partial [Hyphococcus sp.]
RIAMPITALFTVTFLLVLVAKGTGPIFDKPYPSAIMISLALAGMLIFNGVYQNGEGHPPPLWLRIPTLIALIGFPIYAGLAFYAFWLRIEDYGLTPARIAGLAINGLVAAYSLVCIAGLVTELNWRAKRWMPLVGHLNTLMAALWIVVLTALATPFLNPWAISAHSQYARIAEGKVAAADFDYGYLRFELGPHGEKALDRLLALDGHPEAARIRDGVAAARAATSYWHYRNPETDAPEAGDTNTQSGTAPADGAPNGDPPASPSPSQETEENP